MLLDGFSVASACKAVSIDGPDARRGARHENRALIIGSSHMAILFMSGAQRCGMLIVHKPSLVGVIPHIGRQNVAKTGSHLVSKDLDLRERAGSDRALDKPIEAFELAAVDRSLPPQEGRAFIELLLKHVITHSVTAAGQLGDRSSHGVAGLERKDEDRAVEDDVFRKHG